MALRSPGDAMLGVALRRVIDHLCAMSDDPVAFRALFRKQVFDDLNDYPMHSSIPNSEDYRDAAIQHFAQFMDA